MNCFNYLLFVFFIQMLPEVNGLGLLTTPILDLILNLEGEMEVEVGPEVDKYNPKFLVEVEV